MEDSNHIAEDYKGSLEDLQNNLWVAVDDLSHAEELYQKNSNRGEQSERLKQLNSLLSQSQDLVTELLACELT